MTDKPDNPKDKVRGLDTPVATSDLINQVAILDKAFGITLDLAKASKLPTLRALSAVLGPSVSLASMNRTLGSSSIAEIFRSEHFGTLRADLDIPLKMKDLLGASQGHWPRLLDQGSSDITAVIQNLGLSSRWVEHLKSPVLSSLNATFASFTSITSLTRDLRLNPDLTSMLQAARIDAYHSVYGELNEISRAIQTLPEWLKPLSSLQAFQPSWEMTATLGLAGYGRPSLIHDLLGAISVERVPTTSFEALVQMLEAADEDEAYLAERALHILKSYSAAILELIEQTKDWIAQQGLLSIMFFLMGVATLYETHLSRLDADAALKPSAAQHEMVHHLDEIDHALSRIEKAQAPTGDARVVIRTAPLRQLPSTKGMIVRQVYPDDPVRVITVQGSWAQVEVYEYNSEHVVVGWISRRVLRLQER
jgi:hypothetical protein